MTSEHPYVKAGWVERRGGLLLSLFFHMLLFSLLVTRTLPRPSPEKKSEPALLLNLLMQPPSPPVPAPPPEEAGATHKKRENPEIEPVQPEESVETGKEEEAEPVQPEYDPYDDAMAEFNADRKEREQSMDRSLDRLKNEIMKRDARLKGQEADFDSPGNETGTVRVIDIGNVPREVADRVLQRYEIRITQKFVTGDRELSFLNQARLGEKTFNNRNLTGYFEVFELPRKAIQRLTLLERAALINRGLDPGNTFVKKITFGILETKKGYDLGVTDFEYQVVE